MNNGNAFKVSDILYGIVAPCIIGLLIIVFPFYLGPVLDPTLRSIFVDGLGEAILIVGVPMLFGLLWNQWAGGASGFLLGGIYALYVNDMFVYYQYGLNDISTLGYLLCAMLTGYIAGALNKASYSFRRMLVAGVTSGVIGGLFLLWAQVISPFGMVTDIPYNLFITLLPRIIYGIVMPVIAKLFMWYGVLPRHGS
jgi:hypothetical protein